MKKRFEDRVGLCFKANDIRCLAGGKKELNEEMAYRAGRAFVLFLKSKKVLVGRDMRLSSNWIHDNFVRGIRDQGADVYDLGLSDTPALYFCSGYLKMPGAMITASHNPKNYNGIKFVRSGSRPIGERSGLNEIRKLVEKGEFGTVKERGNVINESLARAYRNHILSFIDRRSLRMFKVIVDAGNGMAGKMIPIVYKKLPFKIIGQNFKLDGSFPNHGVDPSKKKNIKDLQKKVVKEKAEFGIAFDGDMDRVFFVDELGKRVDSGVIAALIISHLFKKKKGNVVYNVSMSKIVPEVVKKLGGKAFKEKVGHSFIKDRMRKVNAEFGCENSAHYYYKRNYYADSGLISALIVCEIFSKQDGSFSQMLKEFDKYSKNPEKSLRVSDKSLVLRNVEKYYKSRAEDVDKLDGLTMEFSDWWFNLRASNTEPLLRINVEANNSRILKEKFKELMKVVRG